MTDDVILSYARQARKPLKRGLIKIIEAATGQRALQRLYHDHRREGAPGSFWQAAVQKLSLAVQFDRDRLAAIPRAGPVVVVANHPYGVLDGLVIAWLMDQVRPDFRLLANAVLLGAPELSGHILPIDFDGTPEALDTNLRSRATANRHLASGGCVVVFPAGGISTAPDRLGRRPAVDAPWQPFTAQMVQRARATVVPVCFQGQNSRLFQIASHVSQTLRLALIFREVKQRIGSSVSVHIGQPIPFECLSHVTDRMALVGFLRSRTEALRPETRQVA